MSSASIPVSIAPGDSWLPALQDVAEEAARAGGEYLLDAFRRDPEFHLTRTTAKAAVSRHDYESNERVVESLRRACPTHRILTEESGSSGPDSSFLWVVDPLDGSRNYANGNPHFAVSVALLVDGDPVAGAIYAPYLAEMVTAHRGGGAWCGGRRLEVSATSAPESLYVVGCDGSGSTADFSRRSGRVLRTCLDFRKIGSAAVEGVMVASGRADAFFGLKISPWDIAAAVLIVREAGGVATDFEGRAWSLTSPNVVLSNGAAHDCVVGLVASPRRSRGAGRQR